MAILESVVESTPKPLRKTVDRNTMPVAAGGALGAIPFLVSFLYKKYPNLVDVMPEAAAISASIGVAAWFVSKLDLTMSGWFWFNRGRGN